MNLQTYSQWAACLCDTKQLWEISPAAELDGSVQLRCYLITSIDDHSIIYQSSNRVLSHILYMHMFKGSLSLLFRWQTCQTKDWTYRKTDISMTLNLQPDNWNSKIINSKFDSSSSKSYFSQTNLFPCCLTLYLVIAFFLFRLNTVYGFSTWEIMAIAGSWISLEIHFADDF